MLKKIEFENYRCFNKAVIDLRSTAIIVGRNNAGKSTIIEALRLVATALKKAKTITIYRQASVSFGLPLSNRGFFIDVNKLKIDLRNIIYFYGEQFAKITATFESGAKIRVYLNSELVFVTLHDSEGTVIASKSKAKQLETETIDILPQIGLIKENEKLLTAQTVHADKDTYLSSRHFRNELLLFKKEYYSEFKRIAETTWPELRILSLEYNSNESDYISLLVQDSGFPAELGLMGSGLQMWLQIIWFIARCSESETIILDEPDVYMHPDMQRKILDIIQNKYKQVIIATHSVEIISAAEEKYIVTVDKTARKMKYANSSRAVQQVIDTLGSVHNIALVRLATSKKCLFVEGKDLKTLTRLAAKLDIHPQQPLDTLPCIPLGGFSKLNEAFGASKLFHEEAEGAVACYCILDRDYYSDEYILKQMTAAKESHLNLHVWSRKEIENYLLIPRVIFRITNRPESDYDNFYTELDLLIDELKESVILQFANQLQIQDSKRKDLGSYFKEASDYVNQNWANLSQKLCIISGKEAIAKINAWIRAKYNRHCSQAKILSAIKADDLDEEIIIIIQELCS